jgi:hypothetical protein
MPRKKEMTPAADVKTTGSLGSGKKSMRNADLPMPYLSKFTGMPIVPKGADKPTPTKPKKSSKPPKST